MKTLPACLGRIVALSVFSIALSFSHLALAGSLESILAPKTDHVAYRLNRVAMQVVNVETGEEVFARFADRALIPASTMKLITTATALKTLGPSFRYSTELLSDGTIDSAGVLQGDLYIRGQGDPTLVVERLWKIVWDLKLRGVNKIRGDLIFDDSYFSEDTSLKGWSKKEDIERGPSYFPHLSALSLNFNTVALVIRPLGGVGDAASVRLETPTDGYVVVDNKVITGASNSRRWVKVTRVVEANTLRFIVEGNAPKGSASIKMYRTVEDPKAHFVAAFSQMLLSEKITVSGRKRGGTTPDSAKRLVEQSSPPLASILMDMNKYSNNFIAEQVLRTIGAEASGGTGGSTESGIKEVISYLDGIGVAHSSYSLVNGSGLSRAIRLTPMVLNAVLIDMAHDRRVGLEFRSSLSLAGWDGTLRNRIREEPGRIRGKTGTIDGVHCLTGYIDGGDGVLYAFTYLTNDLHTRVSSVKSLHDALNRQILSLERPHLSMIKSELVTPNLPVSEPK